MTSSRSAVRSGAAEMSERAGRPPVEWGVAARCRRGEATSGDLAVVIPRADGALVAAVDGLGHGFEAAHAAGRVAEVLRQRPGHDLVALVEHCHAALKGTRGAVISLAYLCSSKSTVTWLGIGNVEGRVISGQPSARGPKGSLAVASGVPGHVLPKVSTTSLEIRPGDVLVLATDGIGASFADSLDVSGSPQEISERIVDEHGKSTDDALVVAVRYLGSEP